MAQKRKAKAFRDTVYLRQLPSDAPADDQDELMGGEKQRRERKLRGEKQGDERSKGTERRVQRNTVLPFQKPWFGP